jgi:hypothetical protein
MTDVTMLEAAVSQLRESASDIDAEVAPQLGLSINILANAVVSGRHGVNASVASDIEFAFNDLNAAVDELPQSDADRLAPIITVLRRDVEALKSATSLDPALVAQIESFQSKLRERMKAIEWKKRSSSRIRRKRCARTRSRSRGNSPRRDSKRRR